MLQQYLHLYTSQPMIYFGSATPCDEEDLSNCADPSIVHFEIDSLPTLHQTTGLFFHWYDLSD